MTEAETQAVLNGLAKAKAIFQLRAIKAAMQIPDANDRPIIICTNCEPEPAK